MGILHRIPSVRNLLGSALPPKPLRPFAAGLFETLDAGYEDEAPELSDAEMFEGWPSDDDTEYWERRDRYETECERIALEVDRQARKPFEPTAEERTWWAAASDDDADFSDLQPSFRTIEEWDDLPPLSQDDRDRIEDWVMAHTEDLDARREWRPEGGGR